MRANCRFMRILFCKKKSKKNKQKNVLLFTFQHLHHESGSGVDQEQWRQRRHGDAEQAEVLHHLWHHQCFKWFLCVSTVTLEHPQGPIWPLFKKKKKKSNLHFSFIVLTAVNCCYLNRSQIPQCTWMHHIYCLTLNTAKPPKLLTFTFFVFFSHLFKIREKNTP